MRVDAWVRKYDADGKKTDNARARIKHNGVVIHDDLELPHGTPGRKGGSWPPTAPSWAYPTQALRPSATSNRFRNSPIGRRTTQIQTGNVSSRKPVASQSTTRLLRRAIGVSILNWMSTVYNSPAEFLELLPMMLRLSCGTIL